MEVGDLPRLSVRTAGKLPCLFSKHGRGGQRGEKGPRILASESETRGVTAIRFANGACRDPMSALGLAVIRWFPLGQLIAPQNRRSIATEGKVPSEIGHDKMYSAGSCRHRILRYAFICRNGRRSAEL